VPQELAVAFLADHLQLIRPSRHFPSVIAAMLTDKPGIVIASGPDPEAEAGPEDNQDDRRARANTASFT
jgi:hypothetical protein